MSEAAQARKQIAALTAMSVMLVMPKTPFWVAMWRTK
jgi:hypothetical protein